MSDRDYVQYLVQATKDLFESGASDPGSEDILEHMYGELPYSREMVEEVRRYLGRIMRHLHHEHPLVLLVTERYYRDRPKLRKRGLPDTMEACLKYVAGRGRGRPMGIYLPSNDGDQLYMASEYTRTCKWAGSSRKAIERVISACSSGRLTGEQARELAYHITNDSQPDDPVKKGQFQALMHEQQSDALPGNES